MSARLDRAALVWGAVFTVTGVAALLQELGAWRLRFDVLLPVLLIVAGAVLALTSLGRGEVPE